MADINDPSITAEDELDLLNSTVDDFFSFIYDESSSDHETVPEELSPGDSVEFEEHSASHDVLEKVVDEHFSFLQDQEISDTFHSCEPIYDNLPLEQKTIREEPIYSNLENPAIGEGDNTPNCGTPLLIPLEDGPKEAPPTHAPQVLDIFVPGDSINQPDPPEIINISVTSDDPAPTLAKERKSSVYINGDGATESPDPLCPFTISFSSDVTSPSIYTFTVGEADKEGTPSLPHYPEKDAAHISETLDNGKVGEAATAVSEVVPEPLCLAEEGGHSAQSAPQGEDAQNGAGRLGIVAETLEETRPSSEAGADSSTGLSLPSSQLEDTSRPKADEAGRANGEQSERNLVTAADDAKGELGAWATSKQEKRESCCDDSAESESKRPHLDCQDPKIELGSLLTLTYPEVFASEGQPCDGGAHPTPTRRTDSLEDMERLRQLDLAVMQLDNTVQLASDSSNKLPIQMRVDEVVEAVNPTVLSTADAVDSPLSTRPCFAPRPSEPTSTPDDSLTRCGLLPSKPRLHLHRETLLTATDSESLPSNATDCLTGANNSHPLAADPLSSGTTAPFPMATEPTTNRTTELGPCRGPNAPSGPTSNTAAVWTTGVLPEADPQRHKATGECHSEGNENLSGTTTENLSRRATENPSGTTTETSTGRTAEPPSGRGTEAPPGGASDAPSSLSANSVSRAIRRSLRRLRDRRLSGRRSRSRPAGGRGSKKPVSEETVVRRQLPCAPEVGLPSVRSPGASAVLIPSLLAALTPNEPPREVLPSPGSSHARVRSEPPRDESSASTHTSHQPELLSLLRPVTTATDLTLSPTSCMTTAPSCPTAVGSCSLIAAPPGTPNSFGAETGVWYTPITVSVGAHNLSHIGNGSVNVAYSNTEPHQDNSCTPVRQTNTHPTPGRDTNTHPTPGRDANTHPTSGRATNIHSTPGRDTNTHPTPTRSTNSSTPNRRSHSHGGGAVPGRRTDPNNRRDERPRRCHTRPQNGSDASVRTVSSDSNNNSSDVITRPDVSLGSDQPTGQARSPSRDTTSSILTSDRSSVLRRRARDSIELSRTPSRGFVPPRRGLWPHSLSGLMASLAVTVTMFNISRFAVLGAHFGWQFPIQWLVISLVLGIPLLTFHAALGQYIGGSAIDMWVISPIFQGVGYGLMLGECVLGIYSCVPVAWLFTYFRDSFDFRRFTCMRSLDCNSPQNLSSEINEVVPEFFASTVLQKVESENSFLGEASDSTLTPPTTPDPASISSSTPEYFMNSLGSVKFDLSFNIALIWVITFLALSRGSRSYGKVCYIIFLLPSVCYLAVCGNLIYWITSEVTITKLKSHFLDRYSWMAASREAFLVWGMHGAVIQQFAANNRRRHILWRDTTILALVTVAFLGLASLCGLLCSELMKQKGIRYTQSSFEDKSSREFTRVTSDLREDEWTDRILGPLRTEGIGSYAGGPVPYGGVKGPYKGGPIPYGNAVPSSLHIASPHTLVYDNFYVGIKIRNRYSAYMMQKRLKSADAKSGYNAIRFLTELFPAMIFVKEEALMPLWPPLFYVGMLLFGIAQQFAVWHCVVQSVIRLRQERLQEWETFIAFCCCCFGFSAALPMATGVGIHILFFLDYLVGCAWWIMILQLIQIFAVLFVRGKPCSAGEIAHRLLDKCRCCCVSMGWLSAPVALSWTILVPVGLLVLSISSFQTGNFREIFAWESDYWPRWACQLASGLQLLPLFLVPLVGLIQTCRFLSDPRQDLFQRIQHLYRPPQHTEQAEDDETFLTQRSDEDLEAMQLPYSGANPPPASQQNRAETQSSRPYSDPPPKYTPPPSYSTATGSSLFKLLNRSARGMRYLQNTLRQASSPTPPAERGGTVPETAPNAPTGAPSRSEPYIPPPDYPHTSRLLPIATIQGRLNPAPSSSSSAQPPQYSTLDPLRRRQRNHPSIIPPLFPLGKERGDSVDAASSLVGRARGSFSRRSSLRGSSDFRRSLRHSLRHSARRLAATFSGGGVLAGSSAPSELTSTRACSNLELTSHSEA